MNNELIQRALVTFAQVADPTRTSFTDEEIDQYVSLVLPLFPGLDRDEFKQAVQASYSTQIESFRILEGRERRKPWLKDFKANHREWNFWSRYKFYLQSEQHFAPSVVEELDLLTDTILDKLFDPNQRGIQLAKKGLVVGQVQSGKTANYTGLICKAADAGFNFIIVLAGIHNNLRSQTQVRLDEGFLGFDTEFDRVCRTGNAKKGVGKIVGYDAAIANSYTTSNEKGDFTTKAANTAGFNFDIEYPCILVVKKNASVLRRLNKWLTNHFEQGQRLENKSLLLIDDEADHASINTKAGMESPSTINGLICELLTKFNRTAYVGYTATPFANIFIDQDSPEDLFPRDFIINLPAPTNYIGPERVFAISSNPEDEKNVLPIVRIINDYHEFVPDRHNPGDLLPEYEEIPNSLKEAVKAFILTCAIRIARGQDKKHNSMLIHVTRYKVWQLQIREIVNDLFRFYKSEIEANDAAFMKSMEELYLRDFVPTTKQILESKEELNDYIIREHSWDEIKPLLWNAVQKIDVMAINGSSNDALTYEDNKENGISVIAIGGDKLSRGLTLEGLSISYFLRASKMYDTLMQMGRWFGYRPGYVDLCRLYTSNELNSWYQHIAVASHELRAEFDYMADRHETPDNFALKVRNHDGLLQITAICKMRNATNIQVSWAGKLVEAYRLYSGNGHKRHNLVATENFISSLGDVCHTEYPGDNTREKRGYYLWENIKAQDVCKYLRDFHLPESNVNLEMISQYITDLSEHYDELTSWNVALLFKKTDTPYLLGNYSVGTFLRTRNDNHDPSLYCLRKNHILGSPMDEFVDIEYLDKGKLDEALRVTKERKSDWDKEYPDSRIMREEFRDHKKPLLLIYPLDAEGCFFYKQGTERKEIIPIEERNSDPYIGFAISFPQSNSGVAISYATNQPTEYITSEEEYDNLNDNQYDNE